MGTAARRKVRRKKTIELNFEQSFQAFQEFSLNQGPIQTQEQKLLALINRQLTEDIFNKAFANW